MQLVLDARYHQKNSTEPVRLKYWENAWLTLRTIRDTPIGEIEVGSPWECPAWLFQRVYEEAMVRKFVPKIRQSIRDKLPSIPREE